MQSASHQTMAKDYLKTYEKIIAAAPVTKKTGLWQAVQTMFTKSLTITHSTSQIFRAKEKS